VEQERRDFVNEDKSKPNPAWADAEYMLIGWDQAQGFFIDRKPPMDNPVKPADSLLSCTPPPAVSEKSLADAQRLHDHLRDVAIVADKSFRNQLDGILQDLKTCPKTRERAVAITKIQEAIMWLGLDLKELNGGKSCYANGYLPNTIVDPPADGLKL
jgi:hypothetical protein